MSRELFGLEQGIHILSENGDTGVMLIFGSAAPGSIGTFDDAAEVGSVYFRTNGQHYQKHTSGSGIDKWRRMANSDDLLNLSWRSDKVTVLTSTVAPIEGGTIDLSAVHFTDDDTPFLDGSDFSLGDYVLFGHGGTEEIHRVTNIVGDVLTFTKNAVHATYPVDPLSENDAFLVKHYLPDSPDAQEKQALVTFSGGVYVKLGDVNWDVATGINLSVGYVAGSGNITSSDTVESAIEKLDGNLDNTTLTIGRDIQSDTHMGSYTGGLLTTDQSIKTNIQELSDAIANQENTDGVTTEDTMDEILVDEVLAVEWFVTCCLVSNKSQRKTFKIVAHHNGIVGGADANSVDENLFSKLKTGSIFNSVFSVDLNGVTTAQVMRLRASASAAIDVKVTRREIRA